MQCPDCKAATVDGAGMVADVTPAQIETAMCDAEVLGDVTHEPERVRKTVSPRMRRQVFARDHHRCTVPGCLPRETWTCTTFSSSPTWDRTRCGTSPCCAAATTTCSTKESSV